MSGFICKNCSTVHHIFGYEGVNRAATDLGVDVLGDIPLNPEICYGSDAGKPITVVEPKGDIATRYASIATKIRMKLGLP